jgi:hypothetical protein
MSLVKSSSALVKSESGSTAVGKSLVAVGSGGVVLTVLAALIPFVGVLGLSVVLLLAGLFFWVK